MKSLEEKRDNFISKSKLIHNNKYDYSLAEYVNYNTKVKIICPVHGVFEQTPTKHLSGHGCILCGMENTSRARRSTTEEFIKKSRKIHGDKYDYSLVEYKNNLTRVKIICPIHGVFEQTPSSHLSGCNCPKCVGGVKITQDDFIERAKIKHNNKYDYSLTKYVNSITKVKIICPVHGVFEQKPMHHVNGEGCPECAKERLFNSRKISKEQFIDRAKNKHGDKFNYSLVEYINTTTKVKIICPIHGVFEQKPMHHVNGEGCPLCARKLNDDKKRSTTEEFIEKARKIHGGKYDYSKVKYTGAFNNVEIICPKHGSFYQTPTNHLRGKGCPHCQNSISENEISKFLNEHNISYIPQKQFDWLKIKQKLSLDFYLPDYNIAIECQGLQHFKSIDAFGGNKAFEDILYRDKIKKELCDKNGIRILYYANYKYDFPYKVYTSKNKLLKDIIINK